MDWWLWAFNNETSKAKQGNMWIIVVAQIPSMGGIGNGITCCDKAAALVMRSLMSHNGFLSSLLSAIYILYTICLQFEMKSPRVGFTKLVKIMVFDHIWAIIRYHIKARQIKGWSVIFKYKIANNMEMQDKAITGRDCRHYKAMADSPQTSSFDLTWLSVFTFNSFCYIGSLHLFDRMAMIPAKSWWSKSPRSSWSSWSSSPSSTVICSSILFHQRAQMSPTWRLAGGAMGDTL